MFSFFTERFLRLLPKNFGIHPKVRDNNLSKVSIVYFSATDVTTNLVHAAADAFKAKDIDTFLYGIDGKDIIEGRFKDADLFPQLHASQAIIFASPTYMGSVAAQFKAFADATSDFWADQLWAGKYAAGITSGSAPNGDQSGTLLYMNTLACQHGMIWIGLDIAYNNENLRLNRLGSQQGVVAHSINGETNEADLNTAKYLATRISKILG